VNHEGHEGHEAFISEHEETIGLCDLNFVRVVIFVVVIVFVSSSDEAAAQGRFEIGAQVVSIRSREFDRADTGIGGRFSWHPIDVIGAEAEMTFDSGDFPDRSPFSRSRAEGLFGVTVGPRFGRARPFLKIRPGFLTFHGQPVVCILIFPPPLACVLATGRTVFALDAGGGVELSAGRRTFIRIDGGDRVLKYPGPSFRNGRATQQSFFSHDVRVSAGAGVRF
jgi:hypothetical protein